MNKKLETILWSLSDQRLAGERCQNALPTKEEVSNDEISIIIGFAAMSMSKNVLQAAIERYALASTQEFNIDMKYHGKTPIEWLKDRSEQGHPEAASMMSMMEGLISYPISKDCPLPAPPPLS